MKKGAALIILLAGLLTSKAHDTKSSELNDEGWMSSTMATASYAENTSKSSAVSSDSVVVNWSSICTDLCGAGFGGSLCGKRCHSGSQIIPFQLDNGTESDSLNLCPVLCEFHLGGRKCECIPMRQHDHTPKNAAQFCSIFCIHYNTSISGCSKCSLNVSKLIDKNFPSTSDFTTASNADAHSKETDSMHTDITTTSVAITTAAAEHTEIPTTGTTSTTITKQTETTIPAISSATGASPMEHDPSFTTPDWHMVCMDLCKKGEGGILCNCDLPPLLFKRN